MLFGLQYDWYTKKSSVVVDVVKRPGEGEGHLTSHAMLLLAPIIPYSSACPVSLLTI